MSILHSTTIQDPEDPTNDEMKHVFVIKKISDHEIEVDLRHFNQQADKKHYIEYVSLYSDNQELIDTVYLKPGDDFMVIFDLDKINRKEAEVKREVDDWIPRHWDINQTFHAVIHCSIHGNWSDVSEEIL